MMRDLLRDRFRTEINLFKEAKARNDVALAWHHLERSHVLSQAHARDHVWVHVRMLDFAVRTLDLREMVGQIPRIILAAPGSLLGKAPQGNTGRSNVGIFEVMPIPPALFPEENKQSANESK